MQQEERAASREAGSRFGRNGRCARPHGAWMHAPWGILLRPVRKRRRACRPLLQRSVRFTAGGHGLALHPWDGRRGLRRLRAWGVFQAWKCIAREVGCAQKWKTVRNSVAFAADVCYNESKLNPENEGVCRSRFGRNGCRLCLSVQSRCGKSG